jgi:hypothetical protein
MDISARTGFPKCSSSSKNHPSAAGAPQRIDELRIPIRRFYRQLVWVDPVCRKLHNSGNEEAEKKAAQNQNVNRS